MLFYKNASLSVKFAKLADTKSGKRFNKRDKEIKKSIDKKAAADLKLQEIAAREAYQNSVFFVLGRRLRRFGRFLQKLWYRGESKRRGMRIGALKTLNEVHKARYEAKNKLAFATDRERSRSQRNIESQQIKEKNGNLAFYTQSPSLLPAAELRDSKGNFVAAHKHYNSQDNTVEVDYIPVGSSSSNKVVLQLNRHGKVDLLMKGNMPYKKDNAGNITGIDKTKLKAILREYPEAFSTISPEEFITLDGDGDPYITTSEILTWVKEGMTARVNDATERNDDSEVLVDVANSSGEKHTATKYVEEMFDKIMTYEGSKLISGGLVPGSAKETALKGYKTKMGSAHTTGTTSIKDTIKDFIHEATT